MSPTAVKASTSCCVKYVEASLSALTARPWVTLAFARLFWPNLSSQDIQHVKQMRAEGACVVAQGGRDNGGKETTLASFDRLLVGSLPMEDGPKKHAIA
mmetsp:Transcript_87482/g.245626  ORF Transcript_87482/g.245626 Transcript_87482/m.245626 type:complete len:99 (-) Transcript_87482:58-354(-)